MAEDVAARAEREKERYEEGIERTAYQNILSTHSGYMYKLSRAKVARDALQGKRVDKVLEIGRIVWDEWLESNGIYPEETICINIAEKELEKGRERSRHTRIKPSFVIMDAHKLDFPDGHFDLVCGSGILHHLDLELALAEIERVLKPDGVIIFSEPLDNNPVARLVRKLTPQARTVDEIPFRFPQLATMERWFACEFHYEQLLSLPLGVASKMLFKSPDNGLTRFAFRVDEAIRLGLPQAGPFYRKVTIVGRKRPGASGRA